MKNRLQFLVRTSVLKQFFGDVANLRVAALSTRRLDVAAFNYKFTCQNFDQARGVKEVGGGGRRRGLGCPPTEQKKNFSLYFYSSSSVGCP